MRNEVVYRDETITIVVEFGVELSRTMHDKLANHNSADLRKYDRTATKMVLFESGTNVLLSQIDLPYLFEGKRSSPRATFPLVSLSWLLDDQLSKELISYEHVRANIHLLTEEDLRVATERIRSYRR